MSQCGAMFKRITSINIDTYSYILSRMVEAALKGETSVVFPAGDFEDIEEIGDFLRETHTNDLYVNLVEDGMVSATWRANF